MTFDVALSYCPNLIFVHVATLTEINNQSKLIGSSILRNVKVMKCDESIVKELDEDMKNDHMYKVTLGTRDIETHKVSLLHYWDESKKIFKIISEYSDIIEKYGCDEAYLNMTRRVNKIFDKGDTDYSDLNWHGSYMMSFEKKGTPEERGIF